MVKIARQTNKPTKRREETMRKRGKKWNGNGRRARCTLALNFYQRCSWMRAESFAVAALTQTVDAVCCIVVRSAHHFSICIHLLSSEMIFLVRMNILIIIIMLSAPPPPPYLSQHLSLSPELVLAENRIEFPLSLSLSVYTLCSAVGAVANSFG